jgi:hypothetical protein
MFEVWIRPAGAALVLCGKKFERVGKGETNTCEKGAWLAPDAQIRRRPEVNRDAPVEGLKVLRFGFRFGNHVAAPNKQSGQR